MALMHHPACAAAFPFPHTTCLPSPLPLHCDRRSSHRPESPEQELADLIYSTPPVFSARFEVGGNQGPDRWCCALAWTKYTCDLRLVISMVDGSDAMAWGNDDCEAASLLLRLPLC